MTNSHELAVEVDTMSLHTARFNNDVISNGRVKATESSDVFFRSSELIEDVLVHNGQRVKKGQALARLDLFKLNGEKTKLKASLQQAQLELQDVLIGQGYNTDNLSAVPADVMHLARIRSGLEQAEASYNLILKDIEQATLTAPFNGIVANVNGSRHTMANTSQPFCRVINDSEMSVEFPVLESELPMIAIGDIVEVTPYNGGKAYTGRIVEINPIIDDNGHVSVKAKINGADGLIDGRNVRIRCSRSLGERLVVPKSAVVLRSGREVVFTYVDGKAIWNYVTTGLENLDSYEIVEGLTEGMSVIVNGNENLAHEAPVVIKR